MSRNCTQRRLDLLRRTSVACTPACNHPNRNNESLDFLVLSRARLHTSFDLRFASLYRSLYAMTIRPKMFMRSRTSGLNWNAVASEEHNWCQLHGWRCSCSSWYLPRLCPWKCPSVSNKPALYHVQHTSRPRSAVRIRRLYTSQRWSQRLFLCTSLHWQPKCRSSSFHTLIGSQMAQSLIARSKWIWKAGIDQQNFENSAIH